MDTQAQFLIETPVYLNEDALALVRWIMSREELTEEAKRSALAVIGAKLTRAES